MYFFVPGATQVFPQSYEFTQLITSAFSEPGATCPGVARRNGDNFTVCYYDSDIRPKLMDCDLGEGTHRAYPLLYSGPTDRKKYEFRFTFDSPLILSSFTIHYYCRHSSLFLVSHDLPASQISQRTIACETGHQKEKEESFTGSETPNQNVTVTFVIPEGFREGGGIFLSEVQFFSGPGSGSYGST